MMLFEKHRPKTWQAVIGQGKAVTAARDALARSPGGRVWWLCGPTGTGKTTIAYLIAGEIASDFTTEEVSGRELTPEFIRAWYQRSEHRPMFGKGAWVLIVNEAHALRKPAIDLLLTLLEKPHMRECQSYIFTTTGEGQSLFEEHVDARPFGDRCIYLQTTAYGVSKLFAAEAKRIAGLEGLDGQPLAAYVNLAHDCKNSLRGMLSRIDAGAMMGKEA